MLSRERIYPDNVVLAFAALLTRRLRCSLVNRILIRSESISFLLSIFFLPIECEKQSAEHSVLGCPEGMPSAGWSSWRQTTTILPRRTPIVQWRNYMFLVFLFLDDSGQLNKRKCGRVTTRLIPHYYDNLMKRPRIFRLIQAQSHVDSGLIQNFKICHSLVTGLPSRVTAKSPFFNCFLLIQTQQKR